MGNLQRRLKWETALFGSAYDGCAPQEHPKYGVLNITSDPRGVHACVQKGFSYGRSCFELRDVRLRTTLCSRDSGQIVDLYDDFPYSPRTRKEKARKRLGTV